MISSQMRMNRIFTRFCFMKVDEIISAQRGAVV